MISIEVPCDTHGRLRTPALAHCVRSRASYKSTHRHIIVEIILKLVFARDCCLYTVLFIWQESSLLLRWLCPFHLCDLNFDIVLICFILFELTLRNYDSIILSYVFGATLVYIGSRNLDIVRDLLHIRRLAIWSFLISNKLDGWLRSHMLLLHCLLTAMTSFDFLCPKSDHIRILCDVFSDFPRVKWVIVDLLRLLIVLCYFLLSWLLLYCYSFIVFDGRRSNGL